MQEEKRDVGTQFSIPIIFQILLKKKNPSSLPLPVLPHLAEATSSAEQRRVWFGLLRVVHLAALFLFPAKRKDNIFPNRTTENLSTLTYLLCGLRADKNNGYPV
ncbi:hypothetical protein NQZ68_001739 [Dissostichus eleginoides]|nr:hypothetical protein NQZ68_001739 [Dissostichus eleginoides]